MVELIDEPQLFAPHTGAVAAVQPLAVLAVDDDFALEPAFQQPDRLEHRGLAGAGRPQQRDNLPRLHRQVDAAQHMDGLPALGEAALQIADLEHVTHSAAPVRDRYSRSAEHTSELQSLMR